MKLLAAIAMVLGTCNCTFSECVTLRGPEPKPSSPNAQITVLHDEKAQQGVTLVLTLSSGERRSFVTDVRGMSTLKDLPLGINCVEAVGGEHVGAEVCLNVSKDLSPAISSFVLALTDAPPPAPTIGSEPPAVLRQLEMVVEDPSGGTIPHAEVRVYLRESYPNKLVLKGWTGRDGLFEASVDPGTYAITVRALGFRSAVRVVKVSTEGDVYPVREVLRVGSC